MNSLAVDEDNRKEYGQRKEDVALFRLQQVASNGAKQRDAKKLFAGLSLLHVSPFPFGELA